MDIDMSNELKVAIEAAKKGAKVAISYFNKGLATAQKADKTIVTVADKKTEKAIISHILSSFPNAQFVGEETGGDRNKDEFWIIDPIDGTRGFSRGIPGWRVLIAFYRAGQILLGVSYAPISDELLYAEKGKGAFINGNKRVHVSSIDNMNKAFVAFGSPRHFRNKQIIVRLIEKTESLRCFEPTSYSDYLVSIGGLDAYIDSYAELWDAAPYKVIIEEAGGKFTNLDGTSWTINSRGCISSNGHVHNEIVDIVNKKRRAGQFN